MILDVTKRLLSLNNKYTIFSILTVGGGYDRNLTGDFMKNDGQDQRFLDEEGTKDMAGELLHPLCFMDGMDR